MAKALIEEFDPEIADLPDPEDDKDENEEDDSSPFGTKKGKKSAKRKRFSITNALINPPSNENANSNSNVKDGKGDNDNNNDNDMEID